MKQLSSFKHFTVTPSSLETGDVVDYEFSFEAGQQIDTGMVIQIDLPPEVILSSSPLICTSTSSTILESVVCEEIYECLTTDAVKLQTSKLRAKLTLVTSPVMEGAIISFTIAAV